MPSVNQKALQTTPWENRGKVLLVDDDRDVLDAIYSLLEVNGYYVEPCSSGQEAIDKFSTNSYETVLTVAGLEQVARACPQKEGLRLDPETIPL